MIGPLAQSTKRRDEQKACLVCFSGCLCLIFESTTFLIPCYMFVWAQGLSLDLWLQATLPEGGQITSLFMQNQGRLKKEFKLIHT